MKIPILKKFCCCGSVETGAVVIGVLSILSYAPTFLRLCYINSVSSKTYSSELAEIEETGKYANSSQDEILEHEKIVEIVYYVNMAMHPYVTIGLVVTILYLFGIFKRKPVFMLPWLSFQMAMIIIIIIAAIVCLILSFVYDVYAINPDIMTTIVVMLVIGVSISCSLSAYFWLISYSYYLTLKRENKRDDPITYRNLEGQQENVGWRVK